MRRRSLCLFVDVCERKNRQKTKVWCAHGERARLRSRVSWLLLFMESRPLLLPLPLEEMLDGTNLPSLSPCFYIVKVTSVPQSLFLTCLTCTPPPPTTTLALSVASEAQSPAAHPQSSALSLLLPEANRSSQTRSHPLASLLSFSHFLLLALHPPPPPSPISRLFLRPSHSSTLPF